VSILYIAWNSKLTDEWWIGKNLEWYHCSFLEVLWQHLPTKCMRTSVRTADVLTEIRNKHLSNTSVEHYRYTNPHRSFCRKQTYWIRNGTEVMTRKLNCGNDWISEKLLRLLSSIETLHLYTELDEIVLSAHSKPQLEMRCRENTARRVNSS
jgi:hypothetical protein